MLLCTSFTFVKFPFAYIVSTVFELLLLADILTPFPVVCIPCPYPIVTPVLIPLLELFELYELFSSTASFLIVSTLLYTALGLMSRKRRS